DLSGNRRAYFPLKIKRLAARRKFCALSAHECRSATQAENNCHESQLSGKVSGQRKTHRRCEGQLNYERPWIRSLLERARRGRLALLVALFIGLIALVAGINAWAVLGLLL